MSGSVTVLTDNNRAILLRFAAGKLIHVNARGNSAENAIEILRSSRNFRAKFAPLSEEVAPELMAINTFVEMLTAGGKLSEKSDSSSLSTSEPARVINSQAIDIENIRTVLTDLSTEYIGPMAPMVVDQAIDEADTADGIIETIAVLIPDSEDAANFRALARKNIQHS